MTDLGRRVFGLAAIALGLVGLAWGDFAAVWQPVPKETPAYLGLAYAASKLGARVTVVVPTGASAATGSASSKSCAASI